MSDAGDFECEVNNGIGDPIRKSAKIYVHGKINDVRVIKIVNK